MTDQVLTQWLVSFDTDRIKEYLFATDKLGEVRGASRLLDRLNRKLSWDEIQKICPECECVFFAGGGGAVKASSEAKAKEIILAVEKLYYDTTYTASTTGIHVPIKPAAKAGGFGTHIEIASLRLRQAKDEKARRSMAGIQPYTQPCVACECHPAAFVWPLDQQPICESCHAKREEENKRKEEEDKRRQNHPNEPRLAGDLSELGELSRPPGYIGFIYADGNNMGELLKKMAHLENYQKLAAGLDELVNDAVKHSFHQYPARRGKAGDRIQPYEPLLVGGDDLMIVTVADTALDAALQIATYFEEKSPALLEEVGLPNDKPLTLGIGVVLAHAKFPMVAFSRLALQLQKKAKQRCAEEDYQSSAIDFMVVTASGSSSVETLRKEALTEKTFIFPHVDRHVRLTQRPYTLPKMEKLLHHLRQFKRENFPRNQLQFLYEGLFQSQVEAVYRWGKVAGRVKKEHRKLMDAFDQEFGAGGPGFPPWQEGVIGRGKYEGETEYSSALGDMVEIYRFVPRTQKEATDATTHD